MQIIEHNPDRLVLFFRRSFLLGLLLGASCTFIGLFFCLFGFILLQQAEGGVWILPTGMGSLAVITGFFWVFLFPTRTTLIFDKSQNCVVREQSRFPGQAPKQTLKLPLDCIVGVLLGSSSGETTTYYPELILDLVYWRIWLNSDGSYQTAVKISKTIAQFLNVNYFPKESKAPLTSFEQRWLKAAKPSQSWQYLEDEVERLQRHLSENPEDGAAHQELGILLHSKTTFGTLPGSRRQEILFHLEAAQKLFEVQQKPEQAAIASKLQMLVNATA
ncbi:hypothetical protein NDA01_20075 [Trichocoleus desertorum AS-A10]|uniref:hypothetical protein n=1 Tax=Trichocoleus desertorum TaxID=1481672 RepID=UPI003296A992